jgi:hypothetical protein
MHIINGIELPETKEEFAFVELSEGLGDRLSSLFDLSLGLTGEARLDTALEFADWFVMHWRTVQKITPIYVNKHEFKKNRDRYQIYFNNGPATIEIMVPELSRDQRHIDLTYKLLRIIKHCGYTVVD